ncbi:MAG: tetratricopeptide repeat protein, partial [Polyangiales bacterium]
MSVDRSKQLEVAQRSLAKGQYDKAIAAYQQLVAHDPSDVRSWLKIGDLYTRTRRLAEACAAYERVAKHYAERGFFLKSVAVYKQILKLDPARLDAMLQLAQMYEALELVSEALQIYQQAADGYFRQGAEQSALRALSKTCELDPDSIPVRIKYAEALSRVGQLDKAAEAFEVSAVLLKERGRLEDYIKVVERLLYHKPDHQRFARELATIYLSRQDPKRALAKIQLCFKANPKDIETLELLAQAFESLGQRPKTVSVYREIVRLLQESGREDERARVLKLILELDPHDAEARRQLAAYAPPPQAQPTASAPPHVAGRHDTDADLGSDAEMVLSIPPDAESLPPEAVPAPTGPRRAPAKAPPMRHRATSLAPGKAQSVRPRRVSARVRTSAPPDVAKDAQVARFLTEAEVFLRYGLQDKAVEVLETLLEVDPMHRETRTQLVQLYRQTGDDDKAQMHAQVLENLTQPPPAADKPKTTPAPPPQTHGEDDVLILDAGAASEPPDPAPRPARHASTAQGAPPRRPAARPPAARAKRSLPWPARPGATAAPQPPPRRPPLKGAGPTAAARL